MDELTLIAVSTVFNVTSGLRLTRSAVILIDIANMKKKTCICISNVL